jgi:hypothetical protein
MFYDVGTVGLVYITEKQIFHNLIHCSESKKYINLLKYKISIFVKKYGFWKKNVSYIVKIYNHLKCFKNLV